MVTAGDAREGSFVISIIEGNAISYFLYLILFLLTRRSRQLSELVH